MAAENTGQRNYNTQLLDELEALTHSLYYHPHTSASTTRRTASLALPRTSVPPISSAAAADNRSNNNSIQSPDPGACPCLPGALAPSLMIPPRKTSTRAGASLTLTPAEGRSHLLASAIPLEDWIRRKAVGNENGDSGSITIAVVVQLRDPLRQYEAVGGPMIALIHLSSVDVKPAGNYEDEEKMFKVASLQVGGLKARSGGRQTQWDSEKQRLTAMQWLVAYAFGKGSWEKGKASGVQGTGHSLEHFLEGNG